MYDLETDTDRRALVLGMLKRLPPDGTLQELADAVNAKLRPAAGMAIYQEEDDDKSVKTVMLFDAGSRRAILKTSAALAVHDAPEIIQAIENWRNRKRAASRWSEDPMEASPRNYLSFDLE